MKEMTEKRYYDRLIDEKAYITFMRKYEEDLISVDSQINELRKEVKPQRKRKQKKLKQTKDPRQKKQKMGKKKKPRPKKKKKK